jgi:prepilin-type N-terminal cleavage/methylation domain-containing protein
MKEITVSPTEEVRPGAESGFSLIEVMIAIIVLVFGIVAVANLMVVAAASNATANHGTGAAAVAAEEMENLKALRLDLVPVTDPGGAGACPPQGAVNTLPLVTGPGRPVFTVTRCIAPAGPPGTNGLPVSRFMRVSAFASSSMFPARTRAEYTTFRTTND